MQVKIFGVTYSMGGLTGVGTYPEYCNMGLMQASGAGIKGHAQRKGSMSIIFIRIRFLFTEEKAGELISDKISYEIKDYQLPKATVRFQEMYV